MPDARTIRVFISSPGDLFPEREIVKQVLEELNQSLRYRERFKLIPYAYEDSTPAIAGQEPQVVVDSYLLRPEAADIFVCMFWLRMGTPTQNLLDPATGQPYQSGTEYEFLTAYRAYQAAPGASKPRILLYRCTRKPKDITRLDYQQAQRVKTFFDRFGSGGDLKAFVGTFGTPAKLRQTLRRDLEQLLEQDFAPQPVAAPPSDPERRAPIYFLPGDLPTNYVERKEALDLLRATLLSSSENVGVVAAAAVHGQGGLGKTVLARAICNDPAIRAAFPDGILWATLGQRAEPARHQRLWIRKLGGDEAEASDLASGKVELKRLLEPRAMLLVLDDVWSVDDAQWLKAGGPRCTTLITTRNKEHADGATLVPLALMQQAESRDLLTRAAQGKLADEALADTIAARLGCLPLALKIVGGMLADGISWTDIAEALNDGDIRFVELEQRSVLETVATSVNALDAEARARYHELIVFPDDEPLVEAAVIRLWQQTVSLKPRDTRRLLRKLLSRALIQADDTLHDLQVDYLRAVVPADEQRRLHSALADAYGDPEQWAALPDDDSSYGWRHLATHLAAAARRDDLRVLLTNVGYLQGKIARLGTTALLADFALLPDNAPLQRIASAIQLGAHILDRTPQELCNQLNGRLGPIADLHHLPAGSQPCFRLESQTLMPPGSGLLRTFAGYSRATDCAFSPDGRFVLSASYDQTLQLWDAATAQPLHAFAGHTNAVTACAFSADGRLILSGSRDHTLRLWDVDSGQPLRTFAGHVDIVTACAFSADGRLILSGSRDHTLRLWDVGSGQLLRTFAGHTHWVSDCAFSADGRLVLSGSRDHTLRLWDVGSGQLLRTFEGHTSAVTACTFGSDDRFILSGSDDRTLRLWDAATAQPLRTFEGHTHWVSACAFSPDGRLVLSASYDRTLRLWDAATAQPLRTFEGHTHWVTACAFSPDGRLVLSAADDRTLRLWDAAAAPPRRAFEGHSRLVSACAFSPDGRFVLSASYDRTLRLWDVDSGQPRRTFAGHAHWVTACAFSPDGRLILSGSRDHTLRLWDVDSGQPLHTFVGHTNRVMACAFSPDGRLILSGSRDHTLRLWDVGSGQLLRTFAGHAHWVTACAFSADGRLILSGSRDHTLRLWDADAQFLHAFAGHADTVMACAFSSDGRLVLSAARDHSVHLWDVGSGQLLRTFAGHTDTVTDCAFSPDGRLVLSTSYDHTLRLWQADTVTESGRWAHDEMLFCCAFHPDGRRVVVGDAAGKVHFLRLEGV